MDFALPSIISLATFLLHSPPPPSSASSSRERKKRRQNNFPIYNCNRSVEATRLRLRSIRSGANIFFVHGCNVSMFFFLHWSWGGVPREPCKLTLVRTHEPAFYWLLLIQSDGELSGSPPVNFDRSRRANEGAAAVPVLEAYRGPAKLLPLDLFNSYVFVRK